MTRAQRRWLYGSLAAAAATGLAFAGMKYLLASDDPFSAYNHPLQPAALQAHVLLAPVVVFVIGWVFGGHVVRHVRAAGSGRRSGWAMLGAAVPMVATGYLLQVFTGEGARAALAWAHGVSASLFLVSLAAHAAGARRRARAVPRARTGPSAPRGSWARVRAVYRRADNGRSLEESPR